MPTKAMTHDEATRIERLRATVAEAEMRLAAAQEELRVAETLHTSLLTELRTAIEGPYRSPCYG